MGEGFDPEGFLRSNGTLYLIATGAGSNNSAALVSAFVEGLVETARRIAARSAGARLDPPLLLALDEIGNLAPLPSLPQPHGRGRRHRHHNHAGAAVPAERTPITAQYLPENAWLTCSASPVKRLPRRQASRSTLLATHTWHGRDLCHPGPDLAFVEVVH